MADSLACVMVAFPVYVFTMRYILREVRVQPEKNDSLVRKWLTYIALLVAAGVVVGDLMPDVNAADLWLHPKGDPCFSFDAGQPVTVPWVPNY